MKKIIAILAVIAVIAAAGFGITLWNTKKAAASAVSAYNEAAQEYNEKIAPYNEAAAGIAAANAGLQEVLDHAKASVSQGEKAYEPDTLEDLEIAVKEAESAFVEIPVQIDPFPDMEPGSSLNKTELEVVKLEADAASAAVKEALEKIPEVPEVPDYTKQIRSLETADKAYADSVQKLANVTAPSDSFVQKRLAGIKTVVQTEAVSEGNDPNGLLGKKGGYRGCVYFLDSRIDPELLPEEVLLNAENESEGKEGESVEGSEPEGETESGSESGTEGEPGSENETGSEGETDSEAPETADKEDASAAEEGSADISSSGETEAPEAAAAAGTTAPETAAAESATAGTAATASATAEIAATDTTATDNAAAEAATAEAAAKDTAESEHRYNVVAAGTAGGGAVEIFTTAEEAEARNQYLSFFAGSVMDPGSHVVEGTCVIRASKYLEDTQQHELIETVREALLKVE